MVKLKTTRQKMPVRKLLIYLLLALVVIMMLLGWDRISQFVQAFFY